MATRKGRKLAKTGSYLVEPTKGRQRKSRGTLLETFNLGKMRLAIFSVPKRKKKESN